MKLAKDKETGELTTKYPASFKVKVPFYDGVWKCDLYNEQREQITDNLHEHLTGKCDVRAILKCSAVWFAGGRFGVTWQAQQLEYRSREVALTGYQFRKTPEELAAESEKQPEQ